MRFILSLHPKRLLLVLLAVIASALMYAQALNIAQKTPEIISGLVDSLVFDKPVIVDIRCGEWTPALERDLRQKLLALGIDLRETNIGLVKDNIDTSPEDTEDTGSGSQILKKLNLQKADLLELSLEQTIETGEKRNFFSYARYSAPVYRFELKQIALPEQKLIALREYQLTGNPEIENPGSLLAMKWYEPIIASAILGSLVLMLWTLK
jgi:hypothetical protein